jgi:outer membrane autotransporter protein
VGESFYDVDIAGDGRSDQLLVSGKTTISDRAQVQVTALDPQTSYKTGQSYRILTSDGGIDGQFAGRCPNPPSWTWRSTRAPTPSI